MLKSNKISYKDVLRVLDGSNDSGSDHKLLPGLGNVNKMHTLLVAFVDVWFHQIIAI